MTRYTYPAAAGVVFILALALTSEPPARAGSTSRVTTVRIGLVGSLFRDAPEPAVQVLVRPFKSLLEASTGVTGHVVAGGDAEALGRQLKEDQVQFAVFHGFEFAWARAKTPELKPLLIAVDQRRYLRALLVVRKDGPVASLADLQGKRIAMPRLSREHCRLFLERRCDRHGCKPEGCLEGVAITSDLDEALDAVIDGQAAGAIVDDSALTTYGELKPGRRSKLRTLLASEPFPCAVIAYVPGALPENLLDRFRDGMIGAKHNPKGRKLLELCQITRFEAVPGDYEQMLSDIARAYPPPATK
jgi:ABC-type phosphate/phosphonate transport system substrate-binding protein